MRMKVNLRLDELNVKTKIRRGYTATTKSRVLVVIVLIAFEWK